jgi:hypothetical protein
LESYEIDFGDSNRRTVAGSFVWNLMVEKFRRGWRFEVWGSSGLVSESWRAWRACHDRWVKSEVVAFETGL